MSVTLEPGTLWAATVERSRRALASGALHPIETEEEVVEDGGVRFLVRRVSSLARKEEDRLQQEGLARTNGTPANPFLPYDPEMFVAGLSATHLCLLNKFPVLHHHLLIVTRHYEEQECLLTAGDFAGLAACMAEFEGLGFYNAGRAAGATQPHKHLQLVALPLCEATPGAPVEALYGEARFDGAIGVAPDLPFRHALARLDRFAFDRPERAAADIETLYRTLLAAVGITADGGLQSAPYNLLLTRDWMLLAPRSRERCRGVAINGLGIAGSMFVREAGQMDVIRRLGPMSMLRQVCLPR